MLPIRPTDTAAFTDYTRTIGEKYTHQAEADVEAGTCCNITAFLCTGSYDTFDIDKSLGYKCCYYRSIVYENYELVLKAMKYAIQAPHFLQLPSEHNKDFGNITALRPFKVHSNNQSNLKTYNPKIFMCQLNNHPKTMSPDNCNLFTRGFTNKGLAYLFNPGRIAAKTSATTELFHDIMDTGNVINSTNGIFYPQASGLGTGLNIMLRVNPQVFWKQQFQTFKVAIGSPGEVIDMNIGGTVLDPGQSYTFHITPSEVVTSRNLEGLPIWKRNCRFRNEDSDLEYYKVCKILLTQLNQMESDFCLQDYTQTGCMHECMIKKARAICQCIPWDYPQIFGTSEVCDYMGAECFDKFIDNPILAKHCKCPFDCEKITYNFYVSAKPIDGERACGEDGKYRLVMNIWACMAVWFFMITFDFQGDFGRATVH